MPTDWKELPQLGLIVPDPNSGTVRRRIAAQVAKLNRDSEDDALDWIEAVADFDNEERGVEG